ncbi:hypothetical protein D3C76_168750 [compost metagenome]
MLFQLRQQDVVEDRVLTVNVTVNQLADPRQRLMRLQAVSTGLFTGEGNLLLQAGDANFKEFVKVAGENQQELQAFQQRIGLVQRLFQHADVELQLRKLTVDVQAAVIQARYRNHWCRRDRFSDRRGWRRLQFRRGLGDLLDHRLSFFYCNFRESFGIH